MFKKATKKQAKFRAAIFGPSGSGKTFTALRMATGMGGPIALIDTETGSASKYADRYDFDVCDLDDISIDGYIDAIKHAGANGYKILIIDSLSHGWKQLLEKVDKLANSKFKGNTWSAWSEGTPEQNRLIQAILTSPCHIIATMRSKTEWVQEKTQSGKSRPVRIGMSPEQGKGIEYEFDFLVDISTDHIANVIKDRTGKFQDRIIEKPGEDLGCEIIEWLNDGEKVMTAFEFEKSVDECNTTEELAELWKKHYDTIKHYPEYQHLKNKVNGKKQSISDNEQPESDDTKEEIENDQSK